MKKILIALLLICTMAMPVAAHEVPDLTRQGSIRATLRYEGESLPGGELTLYRVGEIREDDGNYVFVLTQDFSSSGVTLENVQSASAAQKLAAFASQQALSGSTKKIGDDGTVYFDALQLGLYLLVQHKAAEGYACVNPFLVSLPMLESGEYSYQVDASPKVSPVLEEKPENSNPEQPKTGQSGWPIWTFLLSAAALIVLLRRKTRA